MGAGLQGRIDIASVPGQVELLPGASAALRITSPEPPIVTSSVGEVGPLKAVGDGHFEAVYVPPTETYPQVAIIVAHTVHAWGWLALPLAGTGEMVVSPDASGMATVIVGSRRFGPTRAGPDGKATVRIVVPPGVRQAMSGGKRLNLNMPEVPHLYVTVADAEVPANVGATVAVRIFAVTPEGKPRDDAPLRLSVDPGTISTVRRVEPGFYEATWSLPPFPTATLEARLEDESPVQRVTVQRSNPEPRRLQIEVERTTVTAGDGTFDFTLVVKDGSGNAVEQVGPRVTISTGAFLGWTRGPPGQWVGHVAIPERLDSSSLIIVATAGDLMARREVDLVAGPAAEIRFKGDGPSGRGPSTLTVATLDRFGNPTDAPPLEAKASVGTVSAPLRQGVGTYRIEYRPPLAATAPRDEIRVSAGRAERVLAVELRRQVDLPRLEFGPKGGLALTSGMKGPVLGAEASAWLWGGSSQLGLAMNGSWFRFSRDRAIPSSTGLLAFKSTTSYLSFTAAPAWRVSLGSRALLSASVGGGAVRAQSSWKLGDQPRVEEAKWVLEGVAALSLGARMWGGYPYLELSGAYVEDTHLAGLSGSFVPIFLQLGYRIGAR
jgi:hypothetical protein